MIARTLIAFAALSVAGALPALASTPTAPAKTVLTDGTALAAPLVLARHGADDGDNHDANDDHGGKRRHGSKHAAASSPIILARHGADDGDDHDANDDHGGHGGDDGADDNGHHRRHGSRKG